MTIASTNPAVGRQPARIDRLAHRLGLALVAWSERSVNRPDLSAADHHLIRQMDRAAERLLADRDEVRGQRQTRLF